MYVAGGVWEGQCQALIAYTFCNWLGVLFLDFFPALCGVWDHIIKTLKIHIYLFRSCNVSLI